MATGGVNIHVYKDGGQKETISLSTLEQKTKPGPREHSAPDDNIYTPLDHSTVEKSEGSGDTDRGRVGVAPVICVVSVLVALVIGTAGGFIVAWWHFVNFGRGTTINLLHNAPVNQLN